MKLPDGEDGGVEGIHAARHQVVQRDDDLGQCEDGVVGAVWVGAVPPTAGEGDL